MRIISSCWTIDFNCSVKSLLEILSIQWRFIYVDTASFHLPPISLSTYPKWQLSCTSSICICFTCISQILGSSSCNRLWSIFQDPQQKLSNWGSSLLIKIFKKRLKSPTKSVLADGTNIYISVHRWSKCDKVLPLISNAIGNILIKIVIASIEFDYFLQIGHDETAWGYNHGSHHINQSINQSNFYNANNPGVARLSGATARLVFKYKVIEAIP